MDDDILRELREQTKWLRFLALPNLKELIKENLTTKEQRAIYESSDGENSTYNIAEKLKTSGIKISHMKVHRYWKTWFAVGLVVPGEKYSGRYQKIIDLKELGIEV